MINFLIWFGIMIGLIVLVTIAVFVIAWIDGGCHGEPDGYNIGTAACIVLLILTMVTGTIITFRYIGDPIPETEISQEVSND